MRCCDDQISMYKKIRQLVKSLSNKWAKERLEFFLDKLNPPENSTVLDLGGHNGKFFYSYKDLIKHLNLKIIVADIDEKALTTAKSRGFDTVLLKESEPINLPDNSADIVFCNSVIEHVTVNKTKMYSYTDDKEFKKTAFENQQKFADEIRRTGRGYFVQTPHIAFPIESHTWLPFIAILSRKNLIRMLNLTNKFWVKKTSPDWHLLNEKQMRELFPDADSIIVNKKFGFKKEIIAYKTPTLPVLTETNSV